MPQIVMGDAVRSDLLAGPIKGLLAFSNAENFCVQRLPCSFAAHSFKEPTRIRNERNTAQFPILRTGVGIAAHDDLASLKIHVSPRDLSCFADSTTCEC